MQGIRALRWNHWLTIIWVGFTVSLVIWWTYFGIHQLETIRNVLAEAGVQDADTIRKQKMLLWEGGALIFLLIAGGIALLWYIQKEKKANQKLKEFFATFSHELKTSLSSLRLQAESIREDYSSEEHPLLNRLVNDTVRLQLQLENSLILANHENQQLFLENMKLSNLVEVLKYHWPDLQIELQGDVDLKVDRRSVECIFKNIIQNAIVHGKASKVKIVADQEKNETSIRILDNGNGFSGDPNKLSHLFHRHNQTSGSGIGLFLAKELSQKMGMSMYILTDENFEVQFSWQGGSHA